MDVTIIIPFYGRTQTDLTHLDQCLASCQGQGLISLWNDGSLFDLSPIISKYADLTIGGENHRGKSYARNMATMQANTELIYPLDADDKLAPGAIQTLVDRWENVPLYSHVVKWYDGNRNSLHELPAFRCEAVSRFCLSSVNVLHTKAQWETVGGWDERYQLYEDWLYNSKLFLNFCGELVPEPLVFYRQHKAQSVNEYAGVERQVRSAVRSEIEIYKGGMQVPGCCGPGRQGAQSNPLRRASRPPNPSAQAAASRAVPSRTGRYGTSSPLPGAESGRLVTARYVGGQGKGPHYYIPPGTRRRYRVTHGAQVQCDIVDTCAESDFQGGRNRSLLVRVEIMQAPTPAPVAVAAIPPPPPPPRPPPRPATVATPHPSTPPPAPTMDMANTAVATLRKAYTAAMSQAHPIVMEEPPVPIVDDLTPLPKTGKLLKVALTEGITEVQAQAWLREELGGKNRITFVKMLEKAILG